MSNERLPIKLFAPREIDELKVEPGGSSDVPNWVLEGKALEQRAIKLCQAFEQFSEPINERAKRNSVVPFVFIAKCVMMQQQNQGVVIYLHYFNQVIRAM